MTAPLLKLTGISKSFGPSDVLHDISLEVQRGEVLCLPGDNGAGKSTLIKILAGVLKPTSGAIEMDGKPVLFASPRDASQHGIATVHQFSLDTSAGSGRARGLGAVELAQAGRDSNGNLGRRLRHGRRLRRRASSGSSTPTGSSRSFAVPMMRSIGRRICTHEQVGLSDGLVLDHVIECPKHNGQFDYRTGEALRAPVCINLKTYPVKVEGGRVLVEV